MKKMVVAQGGVSLFGFGVSVWALVSHIQIKTGTGAPLVCDVNATINCTNVIGSEYGEFLGIPLGALGMAFWSVAFAMLLLKRFVHNDGLFAASWQLFVGLIGLVTAVALAGISYFVLKSVCEVCSLVQISCVGYFILSLIHFFKERSQFGRWDFGVNMFVNMRTFWRLALLTTLSALIPLGIGHGVAAYAKSSPSSSSKISSDKAPPSEEIAKYSKGKNPTDRDYRRGNDNAPVVLTMFTDFECPYCQKFHTRVKEVQDNVGKSNLLIVFRNWALPYHKYSRDIAQAARCAGRSEKFWEFADWAFETAELYGRDEKKMAEIFTVDAMEKKAASLGVHPVEFRECMKTNGELGRITRDELDAVKFGGQGTPFILLNGTPYVGNWMKAGELEKAISELAK